ncbi:MAG: glutamate-5-semialdehyde dehydrogenase [Clostridia bacterium]|nr:glutamate-5-semialdehyde dehydrogenase [Clostridia bacterium]
MLKREIEEMGKKAKEAAKVLAVLPSCKKDKALKKMACALREKKDMIMEANDRDMTEGREKGLSEALLDRLLLTAERITEMADGLEALTALPDPVGKVDSLTTRPNGLQVGKMQVPLGVVGMIYEARPNVTVDAAGLCIKTGNAVILRGGSEAINSNLAISKVISHAAEQAGLPEESVQLIETTHRDAVGAMIRLNQYLDVLIPRGGAGLINMVLENASVPVLETGVGNCHVYIDGEAQLKMAVDITVNSKVQRPGVCNAAETLLVHKDMAEEFLPLVGKELLQEGVELRGCEKTRAILPHISKADEEDYETEFLDLILAIRVVNHLGEAIDHIQTYGSGHTEAIVTESYTNSRAFLAGVDAAAVNVNASTRFTDGFQYGLGAEIGISTQKLHARGPMGLEELTSTKFIVYGDGQIRE